MTKRVNNKSKKNSNEKNKDASADADYDDSACDERSEEDQNEEEDCVDPNDAEMGTCQCSPENPFLLSWAHCAQNKIHHERNDEHKMANVANITQKKFLVDKAPTEEMAKNRIMEFRRLNPNFIEHDNHN